LRLFSRPYDWIVGADPNVGAKKKHSRFSAEQIIAFLCEREAGSSTADVCRKHRVSNATLYKWRATYDGMDVSQPCKPKVLEDENARLKRLLTNAMLDNAVLKEVSSKTGEACFSPRAVEDV